MKQREINKWSFGCCYACYQMCIKHYPHGPLLEAFVYGQDMHLNLPIIVNQLLHAHNSKIWQIFTLIKKNWSIISRTTVSDIVIVSNYHLSANKLLPAFIWPFKISQMHTNNTILAIEHEQAHEQLSVHQIEPSKSSLWLFLEKGRLQLAKFTMTSVVGVINCYNNNNSWID